MKRAASLMASAAGWLAGLGTATAQWRAGAAESGWLDGMGNILRFSISPLSGPLDCHRPPLILPFAEQQQGSPQDWTVYTENVFKFFQFMLFLNNTPLA